MSSILYVVSVTLPDEATAREYVAWLEDGHVDEVVAAGAHSGMIVRLDTAPGERPVVETHYVFGTRALFERYEREGAPALRADGLRRFPPERGIVFQRRTGVIA